MFANIHLFRGYLRYVSLITFQQTLRNMSNFELDFELFNWSTAKMKSIFMYLSFSDTDIVRFYYNFSSLILLHNL